MTKKLNISIAMLSIVVAFTPMIYMFFMGGVPSLHVLIISVVNFIAWTCLCVLFVSQKEMLEAVDKAFQGLGLPTVEGDLEAKISSFLKESKRFHVASYAYRAQGQGNVDRNNLGVNLKRIVELAYKELNAEAAELALFDESTHQWSQAMVIGRPSTIASQSMLLDASVEQKCDSSGKAQVLVQPMSFAGTVFGALRIELSQGVEPTKADFQVAYLLATQGALMLIDAQFSKQLLKLRRAGDESVQAKTGFLANLSHEIRGPLGIILNGVELILDELCGPITESQRKTCQMIKSSGDHLLDLVTDVLDYAKVEAGKVKATPIVISVGHLLSDLANVVRSQAIVKGHKLVLKKGDDKLGMICDKRHARQMLINFLTNAIKYTPDGGEITIEAKRVPGNRVSVFVKDTGVGIPDREKFKVFGAFERVDNEYSLAQVGSGLGMPLTKRLAEVNDGGVDFSSEEGVGSTFWITMPASELKADAPGKSSDKKEDKQSSVPLGNGEPVLLVEHNDEGHEILQRYLVHQGFEVIQAHSGGELMKVLRSQDVQLAVIESDLPDTTGQNVVSIIRTNPEKSSIPVILLSSQAFVFDIERFLKLGVDRCLSKPVDLKEVACTVRQLLDESKSAVPKEI